MSKRLDRYIELEGREIPLRIFLESRRNVRVALGKNHVILRVPLQIQHQLSQQVQFAADWLKKLLLTNPKVLDKYSFNRREDTYQLTLLGKLTYKVRVEQVEGQRVSGRLEGYNILINIPKDLKDFEKQKHVKAITSKLMTKIYKPYIKAKVEKFNEQYFKQKIQGVYLKYNSSNWGSCSTGGRVNISTKSLLLPEDALDYIVVHELSHLIEMNHSPAFWDVVRRVMPNYQIHEDYINKIGRTLDF